MNCFVIFFIEGILLLWVEELFWMVKLFVVFVSMYEFMLLLFVWE